MKSQGQIFIFSIAKTFTAITFPMLLSVQVLAQTSENFNDNDLRSGPVWAGHVHLFQNADSTLRLAAPAESGIAQINIPSTVTAGTWEITTRLQFNPSSSNFARIFLTSDSPDLNLAHGYFVQVGSTDDDICLYRQQGNARTRIIDGSNGKLNANTVDVRWRVIRDTSGRWTLLADYDHSGQFLPEGDSVDTAIGTSTFAGIYCQFTATRSTSFQFDDLFITMAADDQAPQVIGTEIQNSRQITLRFSEALDQNSAEKPDNFAIQSFPGAIHEAVLTDPRTVLLTLGMDLEPNKEHTLLIRDVSDVAGNKTTVNVILTYNPPVVPEFKDIVVTEIMADYSPQIGLPLYEYIEIHNRSNRIIDLKDWIITDGGTQGILSPITLHPGGYALAVDESNIDAFSSHGNVVPVANFPSLNNEADIIVLKTASSITIDSVRYESSWYHHSEKKGGGWSLEIIDPDNLCGEGSNWTSSENDMGGTPGKVNSVDAENVDLTPPEVIAVSVVHADTIRVVFNEKLDQEIPSIQEITLEGHEISNVQVGADRRHVHVAVTPAMVRGKVYDLRLKGISDCSGNLLQETSAHRVIFPDVADSLDVVINEILFNPRASGVDFVEIYNNSDKHLDLNGWSVATAAGDTVSASRTITDKMLLLSPAQYLCLSAEPELIKNEYIHSVDGNYFQAVIPSFNDDGGTVMLRTAEGRIIDIADFDDDWHSIFLRDSEGVSLERILSSGPSRADANWQSASEHAGFGTPGKRNSNDVDQILNEEIVIAPEIFIPVNGTPSFTTINYTFGRSGNVGSVKIFDAYGRVTKTIAENELFSASGFLRWDGDRDDGDKALVGAYMVWIEVFDASGRVQRFKKRVAVAGEF
jgi:hypothetical protein